MMLSVTSKNASDVAKTSGIVREAVPSTCGGQGWLCPGAKWAGRLGLTAWAGFWTWFAGVEAISDGSASYWPAASIILPVCTVAILAWRKPFWGGIAALAAAAVAAGVFRGVQAWMFMAAPSAVLGVLLLLGSRRATA